MNFINKLCISFYFISNQDVALKCQRVLERNQNFKRYNQLHKRRICILNLILSILNLIDHILGVLTVNLRL
jgi:hypothetical protein